MKLIGKHTHKHKYKHYEVHLYNLSLVWALARHEVLLWFYSDHLKVWDGSEIKPMIMRHFYYVMTPYNIRVISPQWTSYV